MRQRATRVIAWVVAVLMLATSLPTNLFGGSSRAEETVVDYSAPVQLPWNTSEPEKKPSVAYIMGNTALGMVTYSAVDETYIPQGTVPTAENETPSDAALAAAEAYGQEQGKTGRVALQFRLGSSDETWTPEGALRAVVSLNQNIDLNQNETLSLIRLTEEGEAVSMAARMMRGGNELYGVSFNTDTLGSYALLGAYETVTESWNVVFWGPEGELVEARNVPAGMALGELPEAPAREGYIFTGWFAEDGSVAEKETPVGSDLFFHASYERDYPATVADAQTEKVSVHVEVPEGALPSDARFRMTEVDAEEYRETVEQALGGATGEILAVDLTFVGLDGTKYQPLKPVTVDVTLTGMENAEHLSVVHIADSGEAEIVYTGEPETVKMRGAEDQQTISFPASGFSVYAITGMIEQEVTIDGAAYKITVTYDSLAGIPEGAALDVKEVSADEYLDATAAALGWSEGDDVFYTKFLDISIVKDGVEIEPKTPVSVSIELLDVTDGAEALEVVHFDEEGHASKVEAAANGEGLVTFTTDSFSVFGFGSILHSLLSWANDTVTYTLQGFSGLLNPTYSAIEVELEEGLEAINAYNVQSTLGSLLNALYVKVSTALELGNRESVVVYSVKDGAVENVLAEGSSINSSLSLGGADGFAVVKDTGYRRKDFLLGAVELNGMMPKTAEAEALEADAATLEVEGDVLAVYDITIAEEGTEYQPDSEHPVEVSIAVGELEEDREIQIWHIRDDGEKEQITEFEVVDGKVVFTASGFSVYAVVATTLTQTIDASDGNTYEIEVTYKSTSGIPMEGTELLVSELLPTDEGYEEYMAASASKVGAKAENIELSRFFDIRIVDENDHTAVYEPTGDVEVSIRVIGSRLDDYANLDVLHFVEDETAEGFTVYDMESTVEGETVQFTTDSFSVYAVTGYVLETTIEIEGQTYKVTATYNDHAGIPGDAKLNVSEMDVLSDEYVQYLNDTAETLGVTAGELGYLRLLDIAIVGEDGTEYTPNDQVQVSVELIDEIETGDLRVVHFGAEPEELIAETEGDTVSFTTDSFSLFSFVDLTLIQSMADAVFGSTYTDKIYENDDIIVSGRMPRTAIVEVNPAELNVIGAPVLVTYDIKIYAGPITKALGIAWQPTDGALTVQLKSDAIDAEAANIYHMADEKADPELVAENITVEEHTVVFEADSFSVYVVIDHEGGTLVTPRIVFHYINYDHTITYPDGSMTYSAEPYNFLDEAGEYLATQIVKTGEALVDVPTPPVYNEQYFNGWYVVDKTQDLSSFNTTSRRFTGQISYTIPNNPIRQTFNETITISKGAEDANGIPLTWTMNGQTYTDYADAEGCAHIYLAPLYANFNYVNFYDYDGNLIARKLLVLDSNGFSSMLVSDMEATSPVNVNDYFMGWSSEAYQSSNNLQTPANTVPLYQDGYKTTVYITLYGGTDYANTKKLDIYYGEESYGTTTELSNGTLKFDDYDTGVTGGDVNLYAEYEFAHWLRFIAGQSGWGALYVPADYLVGNAAATKLPTTSRAGYSFAGWYSGYQDSDGKIWYYQQVTDGEGNVLRNGNYELIDYADEGNTITVENYQGTEANINYTQTGTVSSTGLQMTADSYLFARWTANNTAPYKVIIWQQKVTDSKNLPVDQRHYDYVNSYIEYAEATTSVTLPSGSEYLNRDYTGFHLSHYDQNVFIDPQGTSVVNVYYDRDLRVINFYFYNTTPGFDTYPAYTYTVTTGDSTPQYTFINGAWVELTRRVASTTTEYFLTQNNGGTTEYTQTVYDSSGNVVTNPVYPNNYYRRRNNGNLSLLYWNSRTVYIYEWLAPEYTSRPEINNVSGTYGLVNGEYVELTPITETTYTADYSYTATTNNNNTYGIVEGEYVELTRIQGLYTAVAGTPSYSYYTTYYGWNNGNFVQLSYSNYYGIWYTDYYDEYSGPFYTRSNQNTYYYYYNGTLYTGTTRYARTNDGTTDVTTNPSLNTTGLHYIDGNGGKVPVTAHTTITGYTYDSNGTAMIYNGDRYSYEYVPTGETVVYDQTRFTRSSTTLGNSYRLLTWSGLYGQTLTQNGYSWSDVDNYRWYEGTTSNGTGQTYLDSFVQPTNPYNLRTTANVGNYSFYHYRQQLDGTYSIDDREVAHSENSSINFNFTNKFDAFTVSTYSTSAEGFSSIGGTHSAAAGTSATLAAGFHVYHTRNSYTLTFATNYPGEAQFTGGAAASTNFELPGGILYQQLLTFAQYAAPNFTAPDHFIFDGWYEDASGTVPMDWDQTMPAANKVVYAKWYPVYYLIQIDPAGGVIAGRENQNESSYFWLQYGQTIGQYTTRREYIQASVEDVNRLGDGGTYYYRYVTPTINENGTIAEHSKYGSDSKVLMWESDLDSDKDAEGIRPAYYRMAEYIKVEDYHTENDTFYQHLKASGLTEAQANAWDAHYIDTDVKYRLVTNEDPTWVLVGWYRNGHPYDFANSVTEDITLTAVWRQAGSYYVHYDPRMPSIGVSGTLTGPAYSPGNPTDPESRGYIDKATTHAATAPEYITGPSGDSGTYMFEGWRVVGPNGNPLDETGRVMTEEEFKADATRYLFQPGDEITIRSEQAHLVDGHHVVELQAYYKKIEDSSRYPATVQMILDANDAYAGYIDPSAASWPAWANPGNSAVNTEEELDTQSRPTQIAFGDAEINQAIHLINYRDFFVNETGDFLLGFDPQPNPEQCEGGPYIPKYAADAVIGIDTVDVPNILYAIWEPMVYVTFVNHTGAPVTVSLDSLSGLDTIEATIINNATQTYDRTKITAMDSVTIGAGQTIRLVLPKGMVPNSNPETGRELKLTINNSHIGFEMNATKQVGDTAAAELFTKLQYGDGHQDAQALIRSYTGIIYTLTEDPLPLAFFDPNGGSWTDISHTTTSVSTWNTATQPNGRVFFQTDEQGVGRTQYKIKIEEFMKPASDPTKAGSYQFLGWTTDPNVARFVRVNGDFSLTIEQLTTLRNAASAGSEDYAMYDALLTLIEEYKAAFHISDVTNLLHVVENYALWNFNNAPAGTTYYAVYAETAQVNYHIMYSGANANHTWGLPISGSTSTGQAGTVYTRTSVTETQDNRNHYVWYRTVVKGRSIIKPPAPSYYNDSNYTFLYWLKDDASHTVGNTDPSSVTAFSFVEPITADVLNLYTSWTERKYTTLRVIKKVDGAQSSINDLFNLRYDVTTYKYTYTGGQMNRTEHGASDSTGIVLQGTMVSTTGPGTNITNYRDIRLYYWTDADGAFYCQALSIREENLADSGYELVITDNEGRDSSKPEETVSPLVFVNNEDGTNFYKYYPVANHHVETNADYNISYGGEHEGKPVWRYQKRNEGQYSYDLYFWNNTWYTDYLCETEATNQSPNAHQTATFTNTRNAKIRFVKTDENGYDRLNGATFTISKIDSSGTATSQVLPFNTGYVRTASETSGRNGRFILAPGTTIAENSPIKMDTDHNELVFTETGTYRLTETKAPSGYSLPSELVGHELSGSNYVDIEVTASGISIGGGNSAIATTEPLTQLNIGEFDRDNEYAVVIKNVPKTVYFKLQKVDTAGNPILTGIQDSEGNATRGQATFTASGTAAASGVWVSLGTFSTIIDGYDPKAYTDVKAVPYGTYTVTETQAPVGYRTADATMLTIVDDESGKAVLTATGGNVFRDVEGVGAPNDPFIVKIQDEEIGYNLVLSKTVVNDPGDGVDRVYAVTVTAQGDTAPKVANKTYNVVKTNASNVSSNTSVTFTEAGVATVTIKKDETVTLRSLPRGSYVVSEATTATNESTGETDSVPFTTAIVVTEPATSHTLVTTTTNTTPPFTLSNNALTGITNTFGHTLSITKNVAGGLANDTDSFTLVVTGEAITHYTYTGARSDDGGLNFEPMNFSAMPKSGTTPGFIEFTTRNNILSNGGPITGKTVIRINGILDGTYTVTETIPAELDGYVLTATINNTTTAAVNNNAFGVTVNNNDVTVVMTNTRNAVAPTGFGFNLIPFLMMAAVGTILIVIVATGRKRRREEE